MPHTAAPVAVDGVPPERSPLTRVVAGLLAELALRRLERILARLEIAADRAEGRPVDRVLRLPEDEKEAVLGDGDDIRELPRLDPGPVVDHPPVRQLDRALLHREPGAAIEDRPSRACPPGIHRPPTLPPATPRRGRSRRRRRRSGTPPRPPPRSSPGSTAVSCSSGRPARSDPRSSVTGGVRSASDNGGPPWATSATQRPRARRPSGTIGVRKTAPAEARSAFGESGSAQPSESATQAPNASAVRSRVPTFPGSDSRHRARHVLAGAGRQVASAVHADRPGRMRKRRNPREQLLLHRLPGDEQVHRLDARARSPLRRGPRPRRRRARSRLDACAVRAACARA